MKTLMYAVEPLHSIYSRVLNTEVSSFQGVGMLQGVGIVILHQNNIILHLLAK